MAGKECCTPAPPSEHVGEGKYEVIGGLQSYINSGTGTPTTAYILVTDLLEYDTPLKRKLADKVASEGYLVVIPDILKGDPYKAPEGDFSQVPVWLLKHPPTDIADLLLVIKALKEQGINKIAMSGFCYGAKVVAEVAKSDPPVVDVAVIFHPSLVTVDDIQNVKVPFAILAAEIDHATPPTLAREFETILNSRPEVEGFVKIFPGVRHGWAARYDVNDPEAVKAATEAHRHMLDWFKKFL